jgi:hypothetical protein
MSHLLLLSFFGVAALSALHAGQRITGPYTHDNLSVYLIHGEKSAAGPKLLTLQQAMDRKMVVVHETGNVNELAVENVSSDDVFIQGGDIVKGGRQDRVLSEDFVLPARSGKVPVASFCVESGRWTGRGQEVSTQFSKSDRTVATKALKLAVREGKGQQAVWTEVANAQGKMAKSAGLASPAQLSAASPTSMQLALENAKVRENTVTYERALSKIIDSKPDVVGYVAAINGRISNADVYASNDLFVALWPKLLQASAVEALSERTNAKPAAPPVTAIEGVLREAEAGKASSKDKKQLQLVRKDSEKAIQHETRDRSSGQLLHKSLIAK